MSLLCLISLSLLQSAWGVPCHFCGNCAIQNNSSVHPFPNSILADMFWTHLDSNCWGYVSSDDHATGSCKAILVAQVFQRSTSSGLGRCRVWRSTSSTIHSRSGTFFRTKSFLYNYKSIINPIFLIWCKSRNQSWELGPLMQETERF